MLNQLDSERRQVLRIKSCVAGSGASGTLKDGDMVLMVGNEPVSCFADVERIVANYRVETKSTGEVIAGEKRSSPYAAEVPGAPVKRLRQGEANGIAVAEGRQPLEEASMTVAPGLMLPGNQVAVAPEQMQVFCDAALADFAKVRRARAFYYNTSPYRENAADLPSIPITIYREQSIQTVHVTPGLEDGLGTNRLVHWCGAQIQEPHRAVRELGWMPEDHGAYISRWHHGSPAHRYGLYALHWILAVNDEPISDLDTFVREVTRLRDGDFVRVKVCHLETTKPKVLTLKLDLRYWPTWELRLDRDESVWRRHLLQHPGQEEVLRTSFETLQRDGWDAVLGRPVGDASTA